MATFIGTTLFGIGALVTCINVWTSFVRYPVHRLRGGTRESFQWVSGFPLVGSLLLWCSIPLLWGQPAWTWSAGVLSLFDTGGVHWLIGNLLRHWWHQRRGAT